MISFDNILLIWKDLVRDHPYLKPIVSPGYGHQFAHLVLSPPSRPASAWFIAVIHPHPESFNEMVAAVLQLLVWLNGRQYRANNLTQCK